MTDANNMKDTTTPYNHLNCQSLFGYAQGVHERSMGVCQLCGCNAGPAIDFDLWRQFTWEHILGESQGGYLKDIRLAVQQRFPDLAMAQVDELAKRIEAANTVTACSFCNSTTSREKAPVTMGELIASAQGSPDEVVEHVAAALDGILVEKRKRLEWKLAAVKKAFEEQVAPKLNAARAAGTPAQPGE